MVAFPRFPLVPHTRAGGTVHLRRELFPRAMQRGHYSLGEALDVDLQLVSQLCGAPEITSLDGALFLDTETTGLNGGAGTFVFLLGVASYEGDRFEVRQWVLPDPADEPAWLDAVAEEAARARLVVSFHGRGFDLPRIEERFLLHGREAPFGDLPHLDLLVGARRVFKLRMGRVNLGSLETRVLGTPRVDDLPGSECPAAWYSYLRKDTGPMERVLEHNVLDLLSLPTLIAALADAAEGHAPAPDLHAAGRVFARVGSDGRALDLQRGAARAAEDLEIRSRAHEAAAHLLRRRREYDEQADELLAAIQADPSRHGPWLALAKYAEHRVKDLDLAAKCCDQLGELVQTQDLSPRLAADLTKRRARIESKSARAAGNAARRARRRSPSAH